MVSWQRWLQTLKNRDLRMDIERIKIGIGDLVINQWNINDQAQLFQSELAEARKEITDLRARLANKETPEPLSAVKKSK